MESVVDNAVDIPQWKKDLIARLKNNHNKTATIGTDQQLNPSPQLSPRQLDGLTYKNGESVSSGGSGASLTCTSSDQCNVISTSALCVKSSKMVQERVWVDNKYPLSDIGEQYKNGYHKDEDSDPEDLHYGPGIVKKLKNKYLSLALRETNVRPSILHLRKATSLENLLEDDAPSENRQFQPRINGNDRRNVPNRYRNVARGEMKRARSVETISRLDNIPLVSNRQSLHEDMLISNREGNGHRKTQDKLENNVEIKFSNNGNRRINRPKRIQPLMNEKEKPPADVVKQAKMIFERRPEQRTRAPPQTGDVAAKVDSFNNIIVKAKVEAKVSKKPPIKHTKPVLNDKIKSNTRPILKPALKSNSELNKVPKIDEVSLPSPIPDISRIDFPKNGDNENGKNSSLSETPDLILTSSPLPTASSPTFKHIPSDNFLKEEIRNSSPILEFGNKKFSSPVLSPTRVKPASPLLSPTFNRPISPIRYIPVCEEKEEKLSPVIKVNQLIRNPQVSPKEISNPSTCNDDHDGQDVIASNLINASKQPGEGAIFSFTRNPNHNISETKTPTNEPLKIEVNGFGDQKVKVLKARSPPKFSPPPPPKIPDKLSENVLSVTEIQKNRINTVKSAEVVNKNVVNKKSVGMEQPTTAVFNFTSRKDVPDYISNDKSRSPSRPELPKPGEGGIILLDTSNLELFGDEDEDEIRKSLECPPSPCDVSFVNDNILIDGKSSLSQKTKRAKLRISFVDGPEIYEYPSETSLMLDESVSPVGHTVPNLSGSSLANYTPKSTEDFQPGVTRSVQQPVASKPDVTDISEPSTDLLLQESDTPFSSGTNADILF